MEAAVTNILSIIPAWLALVLIVAGAVSLALGLIRLGYGAAVKTLVLNLIYQAEKEIQGTKRGAERKAWCVKMLRHYLDNSKWGRLVSWAITEETMSKVIQFFLTAHERHCKSSKEDIMASTTYEHFVDAGKMVTFCHQFAVIGNMVRNAGQLPEPFWLGAACGGGSCSAARCAART